MRLVILFAVLGVSALGCRSFIDAPTQMTVAPSPIDTQPRAEVTTVVRGQSEDVAESPSEARIDSKRPTILDASVEPASFADGEPLFAPPPWGYGYVAPGEATCAPPDPSASCQFSTPPGVYAPTTLPTPMVAPQPMMVIPPVVAAPGAAATGPGSWSDVIPTEGGAISPEFGLPREPTVENRLPNPVYIQTSNPDAAWEAMAGALAAIFPIQSEQRATVGPGVATEGAFETPWQTGATIFEPWRRDSAGAFNRWQSTLQTIRRRAKVRVVPVNGGYEVGVRVDKQLEDLVRPERATAGAASLRNDASLPTDRLNPPSTVLSSDRWIDIGRDEPLEQRLLGRFREAVAQQGQ
ncbi:MAG: hypothetical protein ACRCT8_06910 [Lacipirellulaceae bacterium]